MTGDKNRIVTTSVISLLAGAWLFLFPFMFTMTGTGFAVNAYFIGAIVVILSLIRVAAPVGSGWAGWINAILGLWLLISPLALMGLAMGAVWNNILIGLLIVVMSVRGMTSSTMSRGHPRMG